MTSWGTGTRTAPAVGTVLVWLLLAGCGLGGATSGGPAASDSGVAAPRLGEVEPLADPRAWEGAATAELGAHPVDPVARSTPALPVQIADAQGTRVRVSSAERILALDVSGTLARTVFELGLGDRVVGRDISTQFPEAADLPLVTSGGHDLNAEAILELDPTVIITDTSLGPWDVLLQVRAAGIPVVVLDAHRGLENVDDLTRSVADALGVPAAGEQLVKRIQADITLARADIDRVAPAAEGEKLRTLFLYARGQANVYYLFGEGSGAESLIESLGLYDVAREIDWQGMRPLTAEGIVAAQPDVVLLMKGGLESAGGVDGLLERVPSLAQTPAGQNRRFVAMDDSQILGYGPLTGDVLNALAVAIYAPGELA